jgi:RHS repeat-associated protein
LFFDNLQVVHARGPLLEETHYYPFGLTMVGISSKAAGKMENRFKYNGIELNEDLGVNTYDAHFRELDYQIGRWWQIDPKVEGYEAISPYASMNNNPIRFNDPLGDEACCKELWNDIKSAAKETWASIKRGGQIAYEKAGNFARGFNQANPLASAVEVVTGKSSASDFTQDKPRAQAVADLGVNTVMMFSGEIAAGFRVEAATTNASLRSTATVSAAEDVLSAKANEFSRLETIGGNQSSRTVGANIGVINSGEALAPIKVAEIGGKKYVLDGHHRLEAATRTGTELRYDVVPQAQWGSYGYKSKESIFNAAANASGEKIKLNGKLVAEYAKQ